MLWECCRVNTVAITQDALDALGENNYGFTRLDFGPAAYKNVTVVESRALNVFGCKVNGFLTNYN